MAALSNPVLTRELRTGLRGHRAFVLRTAFVGVLSAVVIVTWLTTLTGMGMSGWREASLDVRAIPGLGRQLFAALGTALLILLLALIPGYAAGAISGERETRTLEMMLCTWLKPRAIVIGKLSASTVFAIALLVSSLPAVSAVFLLGGVSPLELGLLFLLLVSTAIFVAALSLFVSGLCTKTYMAIMVTYLVIGLLHYVGPSAARVALAATNLSRADSVRMVSRYVNPVFTSRSLFESTVATRVRIVGSSQVAQSSIEPAQRGSQLAFAALHSISPAAMLLATIVLVLGTSWAVGRSTDVVGPTLTQQLARRITGRAGRQSSETSARASKPRGPGERSGSRRRSVTWHRIADRVNNPVLARDLRGRPLGSADIVMRAGLYGFVATEVILLVAASIALSDPGSGANFLYGRFIAKAMAVVVVVVAFLAAIPAAMSIAVEKERHTLEMMLATLLRPESILWGKLTAAFWQAQTLILLGAPIGILSAALDVVPWVATVYVIVSLEAFALAACSLGVLASLLARRPARAVSATLSIIAGLAVGPLLARRLGIDPIPDLPELASAYLSFSPIDLLTVAFAGPDVYSPSMVTAALAVPPAMVALLLFLTAVVLFRRTMRKMVESA